MKRSFQALMPVLAVVLLATPLLAQTDATNPPNIPADPQFLTVEGTGSLTTLFAQNNNFAGNTFDIDNTGPLPITILGWDVNCSSTANPETVTVYWKVGTAVGSETNPAAWTLLGSDFNVTCAGIDQPSPVAVGGLTIAPGDLYGFYIDLETYVNGTSAFYYTNGGPTTYSNADIDLITNTGQASPPFTTSFFPREWNGTVYYDIVPVELQSIHVE